MKTFTKNLTTATSRWGHFVVASRRAGLAIAVLMMLLMAGCSKDVAGPSPDRVPIVNAGIDRVANENQLLSFTVTASDPDGDVVTLSALNLPAGAVFAPATGTFTWIPTDTQAGTYSLFFLGIAGSLSDTDTVTVMVNNAMDRPPMVNAGSDKNVIENQLLTFTVTASDPDGDVVTLSALNLHAGAAFDPATGAFTWIPMDGQAGVHSLLFGGMAGSLSDTDTVVVIVINYIPIQSNPHAMVDLLSDTSFAILAGALISNIPTSAITGDVGLSPAARSSITGFGLTEVTGTIYAADDVAPSGVPAMLTAAKGDLTTAYNDAAGRTSTDIVLLSGNIGGLTLTPGLYKSSGSLEISSGDLTFDARGDANAVFIVQIVSTLNMTSGRQMILSGGAKAANIFWQVGTSATLGTTSVFKGNIMADQSISLATGAAVEGRLLARIGEITLDGNTVVKPAP